ncbi:MAG: hypothetical protein AAGA29_01840 [Planctomycetota bacterium]
MLGIANARKHSKSDKPKITAWPLIAIFTGLAVFVLCIQLIPANPRGALAQQWYLPEIAGLICFYLVGRSRSVLVAGLCLILLPATQTVLIYGPAESLLQVQEKLVLLTQSIGL